MVMPNGRERLAQDRASRARREEARDLLHIVSEQHGGARGDALAVRVAIDGVVLTERCLKLEGETEALRRLVLQLRSEVGLSRERIRQAEERAEAAPGQARAAVEEEVEALRLALARAGEEVREARAQAAADVAAAEARAEAVRAEGQARDVLAELQRAQGQLEGAWAEVSSLRDRQVKAESERDAAVAKAGRAQAVSDTLRHRAKVATERADAVMVELEALRAEVKTQRSAAAQECLAVVEELERMGRRPREMADRLSAPWLAGPHPVAVAARALAAAAAVVAEGSAERGAARMALVALVTEALRTCPGAARPARVVVDDGGEA
jgi:chromosome segregation ATPase